MQIRFYFPIFRATQLLGGAYYLPEIKKLRYVGATRIVPHLKCIKLRKYPFKMTFTFFITEDADLTTLSILSAYILNLMEKNAHIQSTDYRVIKSVHIKTKKVLAKDKEGCELLIERT